MLSTIKNLEAHSEDIKCLLIHGDKLISSSYDETIKIWDLEGENIYLIKTLQCPGYFAKKMIAYGDKLITGFNDDTIKI